MFYIIYTSIKLIVYIFSMMKDIHTKFEANPCISSRKEVGNLILHTAIHYKYACYVTTKMLIITIH